MPEISLKTDNSPQSLEQLRASFPESERLKFTEPLNGFVYCRLSTQSGSNILITPYGAHVHTFEVKKSNGSKFNVLFTSEAVKHEVGKGFRGGIPIIGPQFGDGKFPFVSKNQPVMPYSALSSHGSLRSSYWNVKAAGVIDDQRSFIELTNTEPPGLKGSKLTFNYRVELSATELKTVLSLRNDSANSSPPQQLGLHTYFNISNINNCMIVGLEGLEFIDRLEADQTFLERRAVVQALEHTDRVYLHTPENLHLQDSGNRHLIKLTKSSGYPEAVVWNPNIEKTQQLIASSGDLLADEYKRFICLEAVRVTTPAIIPANEERAFSQTISLNEY